MTGGDERARPLRIGLDGSCLGAERWTGVERSFWLTLQAFAARHPEHALVLFAPRLGPTPPPDLEWVPIPTARTFLWREARLPEALAARGIDVLLSPTTALPPRAPCPCLATVHELAFRHAGAEEPGLAALRQRRAVLRLDDRARLVLVPSRWTARDLCAAEPALAARVRVVPQPLDPALLAAQTPGPGRGLVFVGAARRRKNLARLRAAWASLPADLRAREPLTLVGAEVAPARGERLLPPLPDDALRAELAACRAVVLPSLSEGFGLPLFEGLALGRAFLASRGSVHDELLRGEVRRAGRFVDPYDVASIAVGLGDLCEDDACVEAALVHGPGAVATLHPRATAEAWATLFAKVTGEVTAEDRGGQG
ncbi:MAG: glycosyltransferase [Planctomycetota bacterium]